MTIRVARPRGRIGERRPWRGARRAARRRRGRRRAAARAATAQTTYKLRFQNAGQLVKGDDVQVGGRRVGGVEDDQADRRQPGRDRRSRSTSDFAPLHEGTTALDPRDLAVGHRQPLHRADAGPELEPQARRRRDARRPTRRRRSSTSTSSSTRSTRKTRKALQQVIQGSATQYEGKGAQANQAREVLQPGAVDASRRLVNELVRDQGTLHALPRQHRPRRSTALAARRDDLAEPRHEREHDGGRDRRRERRARRRRSALLPGTLRKANTTFVNLRSTLDDLDVLVDASKPAHQGPRAVPRASCARSCTTRARRSPTCARSIRRTGAGQRPDRPAAQGAGARARPPSPRSPHSITALQQVQPVAEVHPPVHARTSSAGSATSARARRTTTPTATSRASSRSSTPSRSPTTRPAARSRRSPPASASTASPAARSSAAPAPPRQAPVDGSAPWRDSDGSLDCDPSQVLPGP